MFGTNRRFLVDISWCVCYLIPHFCREALDEIGAWDPFNVTEDADLGLRLWRHGYRTDMITRPTLEDAPTEFSAWLPQRTRWFKGWMQTWILHMRKPSQLKENMDMSSFLIVHILLIGTIVSALLHPLVFVKAVYLTVFALSQETSAWVTWIMLVDWATILISYGGFMVLCWRVRDRELLRSKDYRILLTPVYWLMISLAAWRGFWQLCRNPFLWEKTPHSPHEN